MFYRRCRDRRQHSKLMEIVISCYVKHERRINQYAATASAQIHFTKKRRGRHTQKDTQNIQISNVRFFNVRCARTSNFLNIANNINTTINFSLFFIFFCFIQLVSSFPLYDIFYGSECIAAKTVKSAPETRELTKESKAHRPYV